MTFQKKTSKVWLTLVASALTVFAVGSMSTYAGTAAAATRSQESNNTLVNQVRHELTMLPWYGVFDNLEFTVNGSEVTLQGQVVRPTIKDDAEAVVKKLAGVTRVVNNIEVLPPSPMDNEIRRAEYHAIFSDETLNRYSMGSVPSIHIIVDNGHVTLTGIVDREADRNLANLRANSVPGVFSVTNDLRTEQGSTPR
ncbi:MAG TPA: BON domain-containing protein [Candidatus Acidoferrales bacterium]|nr:BON domain-containing protein [Candidatus Acidoferrales bacterium]